MRKISVDAITGTEILARDIYSDMDTILISSGVVLKRDYTERLKSLNVQYIYVEDDLAKGIDEKEIIELQIKEQCQEVVKDILQKYAYCGDAQLEKLKEVASDIIYDLLEKPEVMFNMEGVRQKNESAYSHSLNVCALSVFIALRMKIPRKKIDEIAVGSILHDIGFSYLPVDYKSIQFEDLTEKELREIKKHVIFGYSALEKEPWLSDVAKHIILSHHERLDGSGYPFHLTGEKIKLENRIVAVCDEFDRLVYGYFTPQMKVHEAIEYIVSQGTTKYDYNVTSVFRDSVAAYPNGSIVVTSEDEIGIVLRQNTGCPTRPVLRMIQDKNGKKYIEWTLKDLTKELSLFIKDTRETV